MYPATCTTSSGCPEGVQDPSRHPARKNLFSPHLITTRRCGWTSPEGDVPMSPSPAPHYKRGLTTTLQDHLGRSGYPGIAILYPRPRDVAHQPIIYEATVCQPKQNSGRRCNGRVIFPWISPTTRSSVRSILFFEFGRWLFLGGTTPHWMASAPPVLPGRQDLPGRRPTVVLPTRRVATTQTFSFKHTSRMTSLRDEGHRGP